MTNKAAIIEKIAKLMKMVSKNGPSAREEQVAFAKAQKLMAEYDLTESDIHESEDSGMTDVRIDVPAWAGASYGGFVVQALNAIAVATNCSLMVVQGTKKNTYAAVILVGRKTDLALAEHFADAMFSLHSVALKAHKKERDGHMADLISQHEEKVKMSMGWDDALLERWKTTGAYHKTVLTPIRAAKKESTYGFNAGFLIRMKERFNALHKAREEAAKAGGYGLVVLDEAKRKYVQARYTIETVSVGGNPKRKAGVDGFNSGKAAANGLNTERPIAC